MNRILRSITVSLSSVGELTGFLWKRKLWWLIPVLAVLFVFAALIVLAAATPLGPFIYTLF